MEIKTDRLVIKPYTESDEKSMIALLTNETIKEAYMIPDFETKEDEVVMFRKLLTYSLSEEYFKRGNYLNGRLIGFLNDVEMRDSVIELG